jgi:hypothetical protein
LVLCDQPSFRSCLDLTGILYYCGYIDGEFISFIPGIPKEHFQQLKADTG